MLRNLVLAFCLLLAAAPAWAFASRNSTRSAPRSGSRSATALDKEMQEMLPSLWRAA